MDRGIPNNHQKLGATSALPWIQCSCPWTPGQSDLPAPGLPAAA